MKLLVSIIVPVFNVEKYVEKCINSIREQSYKNLEIILINDGSTDLSGEICDRISSEDKRITVIHKKNGGLSQTRNIGMEVAKGEYILFIDSDDSIKSNSIGKLVNYSFKYNLDVLEFNAKKIWDNKNYELIHKEGMKKLEKKILSGTQYYIKSIKYDCFAASACFKMVRKKLINDHNLLFKEDWLHEDELWSPQLMIKSERVMYLDDVIYFYNMRENSITSASDRTQNVLCYMRNCIDLKKKFEQNIQCELDKAKMIDYLCRQYMASLTIGKYDKKEIKKYTNKRFPIFNAYNFSTKIMTFIFFVSPCLCTFVINIIRKIKKFGGNSK